MSATVVVSIIWEGTRITVSNSHDQDLTDACTVIELLRDSARRAEDAVASGLKEKE